MSNVTHGMNLDEVEALGQLLQGKADQLRHVVNDLEGALSRTIWEGPDAVAFKQQCWPDHRARLQAVADHVHGFGQSALNNASEQRTASGVASGGGGQVPGLQGSAPYLQGSSPHLQGSSPSPHTPISGPPGPDSGGPTSSAVAQAGDTRGDLAPGAAYNPDLAGDGNRWNSRGGYYMDDGGYAVNNCTSWAYFRRRELELFDHPPAGAGHGYQWGLEPAGQQPPTLGAAVSSPPTSTNQYGHVMVVEGISPDGSSIRISEMNRDGHESGAVTNDTFTRVPGTDLWTRAGNRQPVLLTFRP